MSTDNRQFYYILRINLENKILSLHELETNRSIASANFKHFDSFRIASMKVMKNFHTYLKTAKEVHTR